MQWAAGHEIVGSLFVFRAGQVQVWRWDPFYEDMSPLSDQVEAERLSVSFPSNDCSEFVVDLRQSETSWTSSREKGNASFRTDSYSSR